MEFLSGKKCPRLKALLGSSEQRSPLEPASGPPKRCKDAPVKNR
ncbi:hypothetical protein QY97_02120 [Bacillus thermotolerans]|uniref:Uncharacterized protein n=1 Tax=Bacillus thermotolerans TaxID=1221996 RepID=A0A0F5HPQ2_BACTR|nr:hypothetical protein QY97_02120 [Bacillus thermotolerans]KKB37177.1 hypothetical protein QY96_03345 [Bacillus thermotolerans]KKB43352.1 hypothetical protein QY95_01597 [Bacillus thermotolerans]